VLLCQILITPARNTDLNFHPLPAIPEERYKETEDSLATSQIFIVTEINTFQEHVDGKEMGQIFRNEEYCR